MTHALIVVDVQNEYDADGKLPIAYPPFGEALANITATMDAAAAKGVKVVKVIHDAPATAPIFVPGTHTWELHPEIDKRPHDHVVHKTRPSSFYATDLDEWVKANDVTEMTLVGFMTQNCVIATAFDASARGIAVNVLSDATGTVGLSNTTGATSARNLHETLMTVFMSNIALVGTTAEWLDGTMPAKSNLVASVAAYGA